MSTQRYISTSFWDDEWIQGLDPSEKLLYLYLMTNPLTNIAGVYKISPRRISFDTGFNADTVSHIMGKFETAKKVYRKDEFIIIPTWPKHQKWEQSKAIKSGIDTILRSLSLEMFAFLIKIGYVYPLETPPIEGLTPTIEGLTPSIDPVSYLDLDLDLDLDKDKDKDKDSDSPSDPVFLDFVDPNKKPETKEDATKTFNRARELWNESGLKPECRNLIIPPAEYDVLQTFQHYSWSEIETAIKNYENHKKGRFGEGFRDPPPYGSIYGFLKTGVARYQDQGTIDQQFRTGPPPPEKTDNSREMREREEQMKQWKEEAERFTGELIGFKDFLKTRKNQE